MRTGKRVQHPLAAVGNESASGPVDTVKNRKSTTIPDLPSTLHSVAAGLSQANYFGGDVMTRI